MLGIGDQIPEFEITGVKPGFNVHEEDGVSAFDTLTEKSFDGKWKVFFFYPKDFTFICPTEIMEFAALDDEFKKRGAVVLGGSTDNEFCKLAWRREHSGLSKLNQWSFADTNGSLIDGLGIREPEAGVALRATFIVDQNNVIQHVSVNGLNVGRNPQETLRILDACQAGELCGCNRPAGGDSIDVSGEAQKLAGEPQKKAA
jgi:peroxiredoxin (alkyl hydroperoxide reductase subunit C)